MNGGVSGTEEQVEGLFDGVGVESVHAALGTLCVRMCLCGYEWVFIISVQPSIPCRSLRGSPCLDILSLF